MRFLYILVGLSLYFTPSFSYSKDTKKTVAKNLISDFMKSLQKRDLEGCYQARLSIGRNKYTSMERKIIMRHMRKVFESASYSSRDNILHLIVRLEQSNTLKKTGDYRSLIPEIKFVFSGLGSELFLQLLVKENDQGISPIQEAVNLNNLAYKALKTFFSENKSLFEPSLFEKSSVVVGALSIIFSLLGFAPDIAFASVGVITGLVLCHNSFAKKQNLQKASAELSLSNPLP